MKKILTLFLLSLICLTSFSQKKVQAVLKQETRFTARGNDDLIIMAMVQYEGDHDSVKLQSVKINLKGTTQISDVKEVRVYTTGLTECANNRFLDEAVLQIGRAHV